MYEPIEGSSDVTICYVETLGREVYRGKMGEVAVAIKRVHPSEKNKREIGINIILPKHENTVQYIKSHATMAPPQWFIVMEICKEMNLYKVIQKNNNLILEAKRTILLHIACGLKHLHDNDILHRDLKPQNIVFSLDGRNIKICDFGLSKETSSAGQYLTKSRSVVGTDGWMSPESFSGQKMSGKSDIYSAGLVFYFVLSNGKQAFEDNEEYQKRALDPNDSLIPDWNPLSLSLDKSESTLTWHLLESMLNRNSEDRPDTTKVLAHPFFWKPKKRISFLSRLNDLCRSGDYCHAFLQLESNWKEYLFQDSGEKKRHSRATIQKVSQIIAKVESAHPDDKPCKILLTLMRRCVSDYKTNAASGKSIFSSKEELWELFFSNFPKVIMGAFNSVFQLPESLLEAYSVFKEPPPKMYLEPEPGPVLDLECNLFEYSILVNWKPPPQHSAVFVVTTLVDDEKVTTQVTEKPLHHVPRVKYSVTYSFTVNSRNSEGMNGREVQSNEIITPPDVPKRLKITEESSIIVLSWDEPTNDSRVTFYVEIKAFEYGSKVAKEEYELEAIGHELKLESPLPSVKYNFRVFGKNSLGKKGKSCSDSIITGPSRVVNLRAVLSGEANEIKVSWTKEKNDEISYAWEAYCDGKFHSNGSVRTEQLTLRNVTFSKEYYFNVWAKNLFGKEGIKTRSTVVSTPPDAVKNIQGYEEKRHFIVTWESSEHLYCIQVFCDNARLGDIQTITETKYVFASPEQNKEYYFYIWARNTRGVDGGKKKKGPFTLGPKPVAEVMAERKGNAVTVRWKNSDHKQMKHLYVTQMYCDGSAVGEEKSTFNLMATYTHLRLQKTYFFRVWVDVDGKRSDYVQSGNVHMSHKTEELPGLVADKSASGIHLRWARASGDIKHYTITISGDKNEGSERTEIAEDNIYDFLNFSPSQEYKFEVKALDPDGICLQKGVTVSTAPPSKVKNVNVKEADGVFHLWWDQEEFVIKYEVETFCNGRSEHMETITVPQYWYKADHVKRYFFKITPINHKGIRGPTLRTTTTTLAPAKVSGLKAAYKRGIIKLSWNPNNEQVIYQIEIICDNNISGETYDSEEMEFMFEDAKPSKKYTFRVWAKNLTNVEGMKTEVILCTPSSVPCNLAVHMQEGNMVLSWGWPYDEIIDFYVVSTVKKGKRVYESHSAEPSVNVSWVAPSTEYDFEVFAISNGIRGQSTSLAAVISPPSKVRKLKANLEPTTIKFSWKGLQNERVYKYRYEILCDEAQVSNVTDRCQVVIKKENSKSYSIKVWAENERGVCGLPESSETIFTAPGAVKILKISSSDDHVTVEWSSLEQGVTYLVQEYCDDAAIGTPRATTECTMSIEARQLRKYFFVIWARNRYNVEGPKSRSATINTAPAIPHRFDVEETVSPLLEQESNAREGLFRRIFSVFECFSELREHD